MISQIPPYRLGPDTLRPHAKPNLHLRHGAHAMGGYQVPRS